MHIHVHNKRPNVKLPHTVTDIEQRELSTITAVSASPLFYGSDAHWSRYQPLKFDKDRLSYHILVGIKLMHNNSSRLLHRRTVPHYRTVLRNWHRAGDDDPKGWYMRDLKVLMRSMKSVNSPILFERRLIRREEYEEALKMQMPSWLTKKYQRWNYVCMKKHMAYRRQDGRRILQNVCRSPNSI
jgi:hypothetical protein